MRTIALVIWLAIDPTTPLATRDPLALTLTWRDPRGWLRAVAVDAYDSTMLFRKSEERKERERVTEEAVERLAGLAPAELAQEVVLVLVSDANGSTLGLRLLHIVKALVESAGGSFSQLARPLFEPTEDALQLLEHVNLVVQSARGGAGLDTTRWRITSTGKKVLADGEVAAKLGSA